MTNYEKWKIDFNYTEPSKMTIICMNSPKCEECAIYKKFGVCECNEQKIEKWLNEEVDKNG